MPKIKIVVTGGPSGGKTTLIETLRKDLGNAISVVPEAASLLYKGGFPRKSTALGKKHAQRAICFVQRELEDLITTENNVEAIICDRGSLDSIAYWPGDDADFFNSLRTTRAAEISRYHWVLHLDTASNDHFDLSNPIRTESFKEAIEINQMIKEAWTGHPQRLIIPQSDDFLSKISRCRHLIKRIMAGAQFDELCKEIC